ncbi:MAG: hypothetical protein V7765_17775 [Oleispira sp.]
MNWKSERILEALDACAEEFTFPVLDNGYVYLAATKMSVYRSDEDWAIVIEVFGFSPRSGDPDVQIYTFSSKLHDRDPSSNYVTEEAYKNYLNSNAYNESRFIYPISNNEWQDEEEMEYVKLGAKCILRESEIIIPEHAAFQYAGIELEEENPLIFEFCRLIAAKYKDQVLCTEAERRVSVSPELELVLQLDDWRHPDVSGDELPSSSEAFKLIAEMLETGNTQVYTPTEKQNTHWENWPEAGTL